MAWRARTRRVDGVEVRVDASRYGARALANAVAQFNAGQRPPHRRCGGRGTRARRGQRGLPLARRILSKAMLEALPRAVGPGLFAKFIGRHGRRLVLARCAAYLACARVWRRSFCFRSARKRIGARSGPRARHARAARRPLRRRRGPKRTRRGVSGAAARFARARTRDARERVAHCG